MSPRAGLVASVVGLVLLSGCGYVSGHDGGVSAPASPGAGPSSPEPCSNRQVITGWTVHRRVAQLLIVGVNATDPSAAQTKATALMRLGVGGVNFLGSVAGMTPGQVRSVIRAAGAVPPFLAVDEEGGRVRRLGPAAGRVPSARTMGARMSVDEVRQVGAAVGRAMRGLHLTMDFAPVADVSSQPAGEVIGDRSFSSSPERVASYAQAFADGLRSEGVTPVLKHFPGMGSATGHTDVTAARTPPLTQLERRDLRPYETLLATAPLAVMTTNAVVPGLSAPEPASLSPATVRLLRDTYGFHGVIITDSLTGGSVMKDHTVPEAVVQSLAAGSDVALMNSPGSIPEIVDQVVAAVQSGDLPLERVDTSVERVLALKGVDLCRPSAEATLSPGARQG